MDDNYQTYVNRVARMTLPDAYLTQLEHIHESPKFAPDAMGRRRAVPFPGYSIVTPPGGEDVDNADFYQNLADCQQKLGQILGPKFWATIPPDSFHFTLADLIWDGAYLDASQKIPEFDRKLQDAIAESFTTFEGEKNDQSIRWQVLGLMVMPRAVGVCLVPRDEGAYEAILKFRRAIYQNSNLIALGIDQQYHLTAHITLGYFAEISPDLDRDKLAHQFSEFNHRWLDNPQEIWVRRAELRQFQDMTAYKREPSWPAIAF
ncbi:DUF1868 domain-containing protein [Lyngbya sp. CCY1209]|uniref:DUF1868 domain-containing protein n=1 Tax=Lyngbya sp. CCY1209 TaxID=2886103 RepID=UPI002D20AF3F|nr:DUF1868 domain-containing protein [Lyngbya sp. CCY1209]MEB3883890.1 DUF1868 domain-containing protein [Lyngbya sp. CCY1209]